jgi:hypothetical protein
VSKGGFALVVANAIPIVRHPDAIQATSFIEAKRDLNPVGICIKGIPY